MGELTDALLFRDRRPAPARMEPFLAASPENPSTSLANPSEWLIDWASGGYHARFGPHVSERTAMAVSAVYRCVELRSGLFGMMPLKIFRRTKDGREEAASHRLSPMFQMAPYPGRAMTAFYWRELWEMNILLWGNHYSIIRYDNAGRIIGFEPVLPWDVEVLRRNNRNLYRCVLWGPSVGYVDEAEARVVEYVDQDDMIHIPGPGFNGILGLSRIRAFARNAVSLAALLEEQVGYIHENSSKPSAYVTVKSGISPEAFKIFRGQFDDRNAGRQNAGKIIYGDADTAYTPMQMSPEDLATIDARRYQVADISRFYGVPLHLLNETDKSTSWGTGLSEQTLAFQIFTFDAELSRVESELNYKLFRGTEYYVEFDRDALLAMDPVKAAEISQKEIASGTLLINERRRHKNRPPVEYGDRPLINQTNIPLEKLYQPGAQPRQDPIQADPLAPKPDVGTPEGETQEGTPQP